MEDSKLKGEIIYMILKVISPIELEWIKENRDIKTTMSKTEDLYFLIGDILEKVKR